MPKRMQNRMCSHPWHECMHVVGVNAHPYNVHTLKLNHFYNGTSTIYFSHRLCYVLEEILSEERCQLQGLGEKIKEGFSTFSFIRFEVIILILVFFFKFPNLLENQMKKLNLIYFSLNCNKDY